MRTIWDKTYVTGMVRGVEWGGGGGGGDVRRYLALAYKADFFEEIV
jgi:hypothetical protein